MIPRKKSKKFARQSKNAVSLRVIKQFFEFLIPETIPVRHNDGSRTDISDGEPICRMEARNDG
jgi:hypothetical protein